MKILIKLLIILYISLNNFYSLFSGQWVPVDTLNIIVDSDTTYFQYRRIVCADSNHCVAFGNWGGMYPWNRVTSDGGKHWKTTLIDTTVRWNPFFMPAPIYDAVYEDTNNCIAVCDSCYMYRSIDGCKTWKRSKLDCLRSLNQMEIYKIDLNKNIGVFITCFEMFLTTDYGETWNQVNTDSIGSFRNFIFQDVAVTPKNRIIAAAANNEILDFIAISDDLGKTWKKMDVIQNTNYRTQEIFFLDDNNGYLAGSVQYEPPDAKFRDVILHTINGGESWEVQLDTILYPQTGVYKIYFKDLDNGIALCPYGYIWQTSNGGKFWHRDTSIKQINMYDFFVDIAYLTNKKIIAASFEKNKIFIYDEVIKDNIFEPANYQNFVNTYPNPVDNGNDLIIQLDLLEYAAVHFEIYNDLGQLKENSIAIQLNKGKYQYNINNVQYSSGIYYLKMIINSNVISKAFVVVK